jgi:hypothetical protein
MQGELLTVLGSVTNFARAAAMLPLSRLNREGLLGGGTTRAGLTVPLASEVRMPWADRRAHG